jgi:hypothetical protein
MYNMIFAKNELMYDDIKTSVLLDILWRLLEFEPEEPLPSKREGKHVEIALTDRERSNRSNGAEQPPKFIEERADDDFEQTIHHKLAIFKSMIIQRLNEKNPILRLNKEEAARILTYTQESYFKHLRLYEFVFNNKTASELKKINFKQESAMNAPALSQALQISSGRAPPMRSGLESTDDEQSSRVPDFGDTQVQMMAEMDDHLDMNKT